LLAAVSLSRLSLLSPFHPQGVHKFHQYQVVGRHLPTEAEPEPTLYRMKLWATDEVRGREEETGKRTRAASFRPPLPSNLHSLSVSLLHPP